MWQRCFIVLESAEIAHDVCSSSDRQLRNRFKRTELTLLYETFSLSGKLLFATFWKDWDSPRASEALHLSAGRARERERYLGQTPARRKPHKNDGLQPNQQLHGGSEAATVSCHLFMSACCWQLLRVAVASR